DDSVALISECPAKQRFALALGVDIGRIVEVDPGVQRPKQQTDCTLSALPAKDTADPRAAESDFRHLNPGFSQRSISQRLLDYNTRRRVSQLQRGNSLPRPTVALQIGSKTIHGACGDGHRRKARILLRTGSRRAG